jgi:hypothetical protein
MLAEHTASSPHFAQNEYEALGSLVMRYPIMHYKLENCPSGMTGNLKQQSYATHF